MSFIQQTPHVSGGTWHWEWSLNKDFCVQFCKWPSLLIENFVNEGGYVAQVLNVPCHALGEMLTLTNKLTNSAHQMRLIKIRFEMQWIFVP